MLYVENLHKSYGDLKALQGISFEVKEGDILGFLGRNGAGKSTTMRIVTGYLPADSGRVLVDGLDSMTQSLKVRQCIGYLPEHTPLYTDMRVAEFLKFRAHIKGVPRRERKNRVAEVMGKTQLVDRAHQIIGNLSKGFKQRVGIADALVGNPRLLILDEPTIGLDPLQVRQVYDLIKELAHDRTVILSTHILPDVEMICNKVVIIHQGITVASDSIGSLIEHYDDYAIELTLEKNGCSRPSIMDKLRSIDGVKEIEGGQSEAAQDTLIFRMIPNERRDLRGHLFAMAKEQGWKLLELRREKISLENVFTRLTSSAEQAQSQRTLEAGPVSSPAKEQLESAAVVEQQPKVEAEPEANADKSETTEEQQPGSDEQSSKPDSDREEP